MSATKCAEILRKHNEWRRGGDGEQTNPLELGIAIDTALDLLSQPKNFGRHDLMAVAAFRYCLGRTTYIVSECADWLIEQRPNISQNAQKVIARDLEAAFKQDDDDRREGKAYKSLGHDCDRAAWERVRLVYRQESENL